MGFLDRLRGRESDSGERTPTAADAQITSQSVSRAAAGPVGGGTDTVPNAARPVVAAAWPTLPPIQRALAPGRDGVVDPGFSGRLPTWQNPSFTSTASHTVLDGRSAALLGDATLRSSGMPTSGLEHPTGALPLAGPTPMVQRAPAIPLRALPPRETRKVAASGARELSGAARAGQAHTDDCGACPGTVVGGFRCGRFRCCGSRRNTVGAADDRRGGTSVPGARRRGTGDTCSGPFVFPAEPFPHEVAGRTDHRPAQDAAGGGPEDQCDIRTACCLNPIYRWGAPSRARFADGTPRRYRGAADPGRACGRVRRRHESTLRRRGSATGPGHRLRVRGRHDRGPIGRAGGFVQRRSGARRPWHDRAKDTPQPRHTYRPGERPPLHHTPLNHQRHPRLAHPTCGAHPCGPRTSHRHLTHTKGTARLKGGT